MKYIVTAIALVMATSAFGKTVPLPPTRPPAPVFITDPNVYGAYVKDGQVFVRAPVGTDVQVDVDGTNVDVTVDKGDGWSKVLPWNWNLWK
jgi:hypothetical protein